MLDLWREAGLEYLLPMQVEAIQSYGLLQGKSLLISAPTSSGKTFCGEMAAIRAVNNNQKAIMLVPLKALASEKYFELKKRYRKLGLNILAVTSDYQENKIAFIKGEYHIAVAVYEMLDSLTISSLRPIEGVGTIILDELQLAASADRGFHYESILSKIRNLACPVQAIGLIGGLDDCEAISKWLNWPLIKSTARPIELYRGILFNGKFHYRRYNDCKEGVEYFTVDKSENNIAEMSASVNVPSELCLGIKHLVDKGEQALLFTSTRHNCLGLASGLARLFNLAPARRTLDLFEDFPDTLQKANLMECLKHGIGFHNADLSAGIRNLLESGFREGDIRLMVATSTLAMGVNFPSKNVFMEPIKCYNGRDGQPIMKPILASDYNQIAGRAGRLGHTEDFGRAIFIATDDVRREVLWESYIYGTARTEVEPFNNEQLAGLLLHWVACGLARDHHDAQTLFKETLRGHAGLLKGESLTVALEMLLGNGFLEIKGCRFGCTPLGRIAAIHNIDLSTALQIKSGFASFHLKDHLLSWLYLLLDSPDGGKILINIGHRPFDYTDYPMEISRLFEIHGEIPKGSLAELSARIDNCDDRKKVETFLLLAFMVEDSATIALEQRFNIGWGRIKRIGERAANLFWAIAEIGSAGFLDITEKTKIENFAERLYWGVPGPGLALAKMRISLLERDFVLRLNHSGLYNSSDILNAGLEIISSIIPRRVAENLYLACQKNQTISDPNTSAKPPPTRPPLLAKKVNGRFEVVINGVKVSFQPRLYSYFLKLYNCDHPEGWVDKSFLDKGTNQVKYIYRLKQILAGVPGLKLESDKSGRYRFILAHGVDNAGLIAQKQIPSANGG
jgi:helicase